MLNLDQISERLGVDLAQTRTIEALLMGRVEGARSMGLRQPTFMYRVNCVKELLGVQTDASLMLLFDRVRCGMPTSKVMEGLK